ncbi:MAG: DUF3859 domain-containing protein, partial [Lentisphaeria bacterium]|nr:DUF3859 domain-containing protein [Lentisphaeria bacterium]NQZ67944.1 DUF3859 domain-containing protein [Lentisphaeria bacterium]
MNKKSKLNIYTYGIYDGWDSDCKDIPKIKKHCLEIPCKIGIEFGFVVDVEHSRGKKLHWKIEHPPIKDTDGNLLGVFKGEEFI